LDYPDNFPDGNYKLIIEDITDCFLIEKIPSTTFELNIIPNKANEALKA